MPALPLADASAAPYRPPKPNQARRKHLRVLFYAQEHERRIPQSIHAAGLSSNMNPKCHSRPVRGAIGAAGGRGRYNIARFG
jgi:hypothetical protein